MFYSSIQKSSLILISIGCNCDSDGSDGIGCGKFHGRCTCKPNFSGAKCEQCAEGYFGFPNCQSKFQLVNISKIHTHMFYSSIQKSSFILISIGCNCNTEGSNGCDSTDGKCICKPNISDKKCQICDKGLFGFPNCHGRF